MEGTEDREESGREEKMGGGIGKELGKHFVS
jgi:hypothetical protein